MEKVLTLLKDCNIRNVLSCLTAGLPKKKYTKQLEQYYSLYCMLVESWNPTEVPKMIITSFKQTGSKLGIPVYTFLGIRNCGYKSNFAEVPIDWKEVINGEVEVLIPKCLLDVADEELLIAEVLYQLDRVSPTIIPKREHKKLFDSVRESNKGQKSRLYAIEKILELNLCYHVDRRCVENDILEYEESKGVLVKWRELLENRINHLNTYAMYFGNPQALNRTNSSDNVSSMGKWFTSLDMEIRPDNVRCDIRKAVLNSMFEEIELSDYQNVMDEHMRIIVENNPSYPELPVVFIRDKYGEKRKLSDVRFSELLCMDIFVLDEKITEPSHVLAILLFYMEYPLRIERIQKEYMLLALLGMKMKYEWQKKES